MKYITTVIWVANEIILTKKGGNTILQLNKENGKTKRSYNAICMHVKHTRDCETN